MVADPECLLLCLICRHHHHHFNLLLLLLLHIQGSQVSSYTPADMQLHQEATTDGLHISNAATVAPSLSLPASTLLAGKGVWSRLLTGPHPPPAPPPPHAQTGQPGPIGWPGGRGQTMGRGRGQREEEEAKR